MNRENFFYAVVAHNDKSVNAVDRRKEVDCSLTWGQLRRWSMIFLVGGLLLPALTQAQTLFTVAGKSTGELGYSGDGGQATSAMLNYPRNIGTDAKGNLYIADSENDRIRKVDEYGVITTVAGNGVRGFSGDGGLATAASFYFPTDVAVDSKGNIYICDSYNHVIRKVDVSTKKISTVAGRNPTDGGADIGDEGPATSGYLYYPWGIALDASDNLYIAEQVQHHRIRKVTASTGIITTVAGNGTEGFSGDGGLATEASLGILWDVAVDKKTGDVYIADGQYYRVRKVTVTDGKINTIAGTGVQAYNDGDGGSATSANVDPMSLDVDANGNLYITDWHNYIIRKVTPSGIISTLAGKDRSNTYDYSVDGKAALNVSFYDPFGMAIDPSGKILVADTNRVFKITTTDGKSDIVWRNTSSSSSSKGQNAFWFSANSSLTKILSTRTDLNWKIAAVGDFNGDGSKDLLWRYIQPTTLTARKPSTDNGTNEIWFSGESSTGMTLSLNSLSTDWVVAGVGNFDGDNYADIVWRNSVTGDNQLWLDGTTSSTLTNQPINWQLAGVGDFNGDGVSDLVWRNSSTGANTIWKSANSSTQQTMTLVSDLNWKIVGVGDFNGDRVSDLVWRNGFTGANTIWLSATSSTQQAMTTISDLNWKIVGVGNVDGDVDGKSDLVWRNSSTGANTIWLSASSGTQQTVTSLDTAWQVAGVGDF